MDSVIEYLPAVTVRSQLIYSIVLVAIIVALAALPFINVDVSVQAAGLVRPVTERSEIKASVSGRVTAVFVQENQSVRAGNAMLQLQTDVVNTKLRLLAAQQAEKQNHIHDLQVLLRFDLPNSPTIEKTWSVSGLISSLYQQQYEQFRFLANENLETQAKRQRELIMSRQLYADRVIARIELEDKEFALNTVVAQCKTLIERQRSEWQAALTEKQLALTELRAQERQIR